MNLEESIRQSPLVTALQSRYEALGPRDRLAVNWLVGFLAVVLVIFAMIIPATRYMNASAERYQQALEDHQWIEVNRSAVQSAAEQPGTGGQSLLGVANSTAKRFQLGFKRYEPMGDNALSLWIEGVSFNKLVLWLERLDKRHKINVREISVERLPAEGMVNARLVLQG